MSLTNTETTVSIRFPLICEYLVYLTLDKCPVLQLLSGGPGVASAAGPGRGPGHRPHGGERRREDRGGQAGDAVHRRRHRSHQGVPGHQVPAPTVKPGP